MLRENNWMRTTSVTVMVIFSRKCHSESTKFFLKDYEASQQRLLKETLKLRALRTWIIIGVKMLQPQNVIIFFIFHETFVTVNGENYS